eukprot:scaffold30932_cov80-Skeletonema_marinoi.AAC.1
MVDVGEGGGGKIADRRQIFGQHAYMSHSSKLKTRPTFDIMRHEPWRPLTSLNTVDKSSP